VYSSVLGVEESLFPDFSADDKAIRYFPQMMKVPEGRGPKENRFAFEKDAEITLRQLISNTSGYMKPGEYPGMVFNYQTYGMNILTHALAARHDLYRSDDPEGSAGFGELVERYIASPIGCDWTYTYTNFDLHTQALIDIFGYYCQIWTTSRDFARVALLWNSGGAWRGRQIIPEKWLSDAVRVSDDLRNNAQEDEWLYGMGFWSNELGKLWPNLPADGFAACGAGGHYACCFPSEDLVVIQCPGPPHTRPEDRGNPILLEMILDGRM
jgi:CubicO group peptidase (beta-lactamase class C family)